MVDRLPYSAEWDEKRGEESEGGRDTEREVGRGSRWSSVGRSIQTPIEDEDRIKVMRVEAREKCRKRV